MNRLLFFFSCMIFFVAAAGQRNYQQAIDSGYYYYKKGDYKTAINKYFAAEAFDPTKKDVVKDSVNKAFDAIDALRKKAEYAERQTKIANEKALISLNKANKLIDAFYFYDGKFALALGGDEIERKFYFIDKNGNKADSLGEWDKAEQFEDETGFAKVKNVEGTELVEYLLDTSGKRYLVAYELKDLFDGIKALDLSGAKWESFPAAILEQKQLQVLILNSYVGKGNKIEKLPTGIGELQNLKYLHLQFCGIIDSLPSQIGELKNLKVLNLSMNRLKKLPGEIGKLKNLISLDLNINHLDSLPTEIGDLKNLIRLDLSYNALNSLPDRINECKKMTMLDLTMNNFDSLPIQICELNNLTTLSLESNQLTKLPPEIRKLKKMEFLYLSGNKIPQKKIKEIKRALPNCEVITD